MIHGIFLILGCFVAVSGLSDEDIRLEVKRIHTISLKQLKMELSSQNETLSELYEIAAKKEKQKGTKAAMKVWRSTLESQYKDAVDTFLILQETCQIVYRNDTRCPKDEIWEFKYDSRGVNHRKSLKSEIQQLIKTSEEKKRKTGYGKSKRKEKLGKSAPRGKNDL